ncbi:unnamed protein product [Auanema sp. JU1783]|nr:unnamed protein product [Auanema sp. JU1783]
MYRSSSSHYDDSMNDNWMHRDVSSLHCYDRNRYEPHRFEHHSMQGPSTMMRDNVGPYHTESWRRGPYGTPDARYQDANSPARHHPYDYYPADPRYHQDYNQSSFVPRELPPNGNQFHSHRPPHNYALNRPQEPNQFQRRFKDEDRFGRNRKFDTRRNFKNRKNKQLKKDDKDHATSSSTDFEQDAAKINTSREQSQHRAGVSSMLPTSSETVANVSASEINLDGYANNSCGEASTNSIGNSERREDTQEKVGTKLNNHCDKKSSQDLKSQSNVQLETSFQEMEPNDTNEFKDDISLHGSDISDLDDDWREIIDLVDGKIKPSDILNSLNRSGNENRDMYRTY